MPHTQLEPVVRHLHRLARTRWNHDLSDAQLLQRFAADREETAFAALVERHGRLVLGVCRQVLRHEQDAEDAFQATFLVLARQAASIHRSEAVGSWLYRVAYRIAVKAGVDMAKRRAREREVGNRLPKEAPSDTGWRELQEVLQEELTRLPTQYRAPFVLCCLEGRSGAEAAALLGWKEGTVTGRLTRARQMLQQRLARRGVALTAVLTATALTVRSASAEVSAILADATVRAAALYAAGKGTAGGAVSATVATLVRGASRTTLFNGARATTALLVLVGLMTGAGVLTREAFADRQAGAPQAAAAEAPPAKGSQQPPAASSLEADRSVEMNGTVLGPDGKPFAGAQLYLWTSALKQHADMAVRATTGEDGRFRFAVAPADLERRPRVVATAKDWGPDWIDAGSAKGGELTLRLVKDDVPLNGRVLDLEGQPVADVAVQVQYLEARPEGGDLAPWIEVKRKWARKDYVPGIETKTVPAPALGVPLSTTTDKEGRFHLAGFGNERVVHLEIRGKDLEHSQIEVLTRPGPLTGVRTGNGGAYPASFDYHIGPSKPIVGTVRDKRTGKPLAGMTVAGAASPGASIGAYPDEKAVTDSEGKYQLAGIGKCEMYWVAAEGVPYFNTTKLHVKDTGGLEPLAVDFDLERGIMLKGRLTDKVTGKPVRGHVSYMAAAENPNLKDFTELTLLHVRQTALGETGPDGSFTEIAIPGPGLLCVRADDMDGYIGAEIPGWDGFLLKAVPNGIHPSQFHAVIPINPAEDDPKSTTCDIALEPGRTRAGNVVGPDDQPLAGAHVAGLVPLPRFPVRTLDRESVKHLGLKTADFTVQGLSPRNARNLVFFHPEKKLGKVQPVRGDEDGPVTVRLEPLGGITGRLLDAQGRPWAGLTVIAAITRKITDYKDLPWETLENLGPVMAVTLKTDAEGKFRIDGLLPGLKYHLVVSDGELKPGKFVAYHIEELSSESGKIRDLGDLKSTESPDQEGKEKE
jgi:RNA polymerase sigma factor (sigma-70 family)